MNDFWLNFDINRWHLGLTLKRLLVCLQAALLLICHNSFADDSAYQFTAEDKKFLARFMLSELPPLPAAPDNAVADDLAAAKLGYQLFFDPRLSINQSVSCASCHIPEKFFTDGLPVSVGIGKTVRNTPSIPGSIFGEWFYWDGRKDSLWSQALTPLEHPDEQGSNRLQLAKIITDHYLEAYSGVYGTLPNQDQVMARLQSYASPAKPGDDPIASNNWKSISKVDQQAVNRIFTNIGKALMAYQRKLLLTPSRFDRFLKVLIDENGDLESLKAAYTNDEVSGMRIFMGVGNCSSCHNGPMLSNLEFHNIGAPEANEDAVDLGRYNAIEELTKDQFTCLSEWSDAAPQDCEEMNYLKVSGPELVGAFKTPSLRNISNTAPYMQQGQIASLAEVVAHYNKPSPPFFDREQHPNRPHFDILPLNLDESQQAQLIAFLNTLTSEYETLDEMWWQPPDPSIYQ